jgi:hypothetical protein
MTVTVMISRLKPYSTLEAGIIGDAEIAAVAIARRRKMRRKSSTEKMDVVQ